MIVNKILISMAVLAPISAIMADMICALIWLIVREHIQELTPFLTRLTFGYSGKQWGNEAERSRVVLHPLSMIQRC